ncbi:MAG: CRISPR-associated protein Cas4, partial [Thermoprotei archaeon]
GEARDFHALTAAGYALALESEGEAEVNYGVIAYLRMSGKIPSVESKYFVVGDELRREFLEIRDEAFRVLETGKDPGKPDRCPAYCPYYSVCNP